MERTTSTPKCLSIRFILGYRLTGEAFGITRPFDSPAWPTEASDYCCTAPATGARAPARDVRMARLQVAWTVRVEPRFATIGWVVASMTTASASGMPAPISSGAMIGHLSWFFSATGRPWPQLVVE